MGIGGAIAVGIGVACSIGGLTLGIIGAVNAADQAAEMERQAKESEKNAGSQWMNAEINAKKQKALALAEMANGIDSKGETLAKNANITSTEAKAGPDGQYMGEPTEASPSQVV